MIEIYLVENALYSNNFYGHPVFSLVIVIWKKPLKKSRTTAYQITWFKTQLPVLHTSAIRWFYVYRKPEE